MNDKQRQIARKLVELLTEAHYIISVWVDEDYTIKLSHDINDILAAMGTSHMDTLEIDVSLDVKHDDPYQGDVYLIYSDGNIIIDDSVRPAIKPIIDQAMEFAANLTAEAAS